LARVVAALLEASPYHEKTLQYQVQPLFFLNNPEQIDDEIPNIPDKLKKLQVARNLTAA